MGKPLKTHELLGVDLSSSVIPQDVIAKVRPIMTTPDITGNDVLLSECVPQ